MTSPDDNGVATWHSCSICFEEKFEEDLLVHRSCNGALCVECLQTTIQHNQTPGGQFPCPVSQHPVFFKNKKNFQEKILTQMKS